MRKRRLLTALFLAAGIFFLTMVAFSAGTLTPKDESPPANTRSPKTFSPGSGYPGTTDNPSKSEPEQELARLISQLLKGEKVEVRRPAAYLSHRAWRKLWNQKRERPDGKFAV